MDRLSVEDERVVAWLHQTAMVGVALQQDELEQAKSIIEVMLNHMGPIVAKMDQEKVGAFVEGVYDYMKGTENDDLPTR